MGGTNCQDYTVTATGDAAWGLATAAATIAADGTLTPATP